MLVVVTPKSNASSNSNGRSDDQYHDIDYQ